MSKREDFLQLVQLALQLRDDHPDGWRGRVELLAAAQAVPPAQIPNNYPAAALQYVDAAYAGQPPPRWAFTSGTLGTHLLQPQGEGEPPLPACAQFADPTRYRGWRLTEERSQLTCAGCISIYEAKVQAAVKGQPHAD